MPALITHDRFAVSVFEQAPKYLSASVKTAPMAFRWGAQGPDILFFHRPWMDNNISRVGHRMHKERIYRIFSAMTAACAKEQNAASTAYLLGFCCHYALDKTVHPFVTYMTNYRLDPLYPHRSHDSLHNICEAEFDRAVLEKEGIESPAYHADQMLTADPISCKAAASLISPASWDVYGTKVNTSAVTRSMRTMLQLQRLLHDKNGNRQAAFDRFSGISAAATLSSLVRPQQPLSVDCLNLTHQPWIDAAQPYRRCYTDLFQLMQQAQRPALRLMDACYHSIQSGEPLPESLFDLDFNGNHI